MGNCLMYVFDIRMARILGVNIPDQKKIFISLTYIHGIGRHLSKKILDQVGIVHDTKTCTLNETALKKISNVIDSSYEVEGNLRSKVASNIKTLMDIKSYSGMRHIRRL